MKKKLLESMFPCFLDVTTQISLEISPSYYLLRRFILCVIIKVFEPFISIFLGTVKSVMPKALTK